MLRYNAYNVPRLREIMGQLANFFLNQRAVLATPHWRRSWLLPVGTLILLLLPWLTGYVRPAIGVDTRPVDDHWVITHVVPQHPASQAGVQVGDVVLEIDGSQLGFSRTSDPGSYLEAARSLTVLRDGQELTLAIRRDRMSWVTLAEPIGLFLVSLVYWALATGVRLLKPDDPLVGRFYVMNLAIAATLAFDAPSQADVLWAEILETAALSLVPTLCMAFFHEAVRGTSASPRAKRWFKRFAIGGLSIGGVYIVLGFTSSEWFDIAQSFLFSLLAAFCLGSIVWLVRIETTTQSRELRRQARILLLGISLAVLPISLLALIPLGIGARAIVEPSIAAVSTVFLPVCFAYAILRHNLLGIDVVVGRTLVYGSMTLLLAGCYALFLDAVQLLGQGQRSGSVVAVLFFAGVTLSFTPVQDWLRSRIDRLIYRDQYDYAELLRVIGARLASVTPLEELLRGLTDSLATAMNLRGVAVLVRELDGALVVRGASGDYRDPAVSRWLVAQYSHAMPSSTGAVVRLMANGEENGAIILGPKRSRTELTSQDLSLAETIASQASVALANALLVERLQAKVIELELLRDQLLQVRDSERKRLAQDLHDGALHTVLALVRQAESAAEHVTTGIDSSVLQQRLHDLAERGQDAAYDLRTVCSALYPSELSHLGLVAALESLAQEISRNENLIVHFQATGLAGGGRLPEAVEETLFRVTREAVGNISQHAGAEDAWIQLSAHDDQVHLVIRDNGRGFVVPTNLSAILRTGHLGLASMREKIAQLGGEFTIVSRPGDGTEISVHLSCPREKVSETSRHANSPEEVA